MPLYEDRGESSAQPMTDRRELCKTNRSVGVGGFAGRDLQPGTCDDRCGKTTE